MMGRTFAIICAVVCIHLTLVFGDSCSSCHEQTVVTHPEKSTDCDVSQYWDLRNKLNIWTSLRQYLDISVVITAAYKQIHHCATDECAYRKLFLEHVSSSVPSITDHEMHEIYCITKTSGSCWHYQGNSKRAIPAETLQSLSLITYIPHSCLQEVIDFHIGDILKNLYFPPLPTEPSTPTTTTAPAMTTTPTTPTTPTMTTTPTTTTTSTTTTTPTTSTTNELSTKATTTPTSTQHLKSTVSPTKHTVTTSGRISTKQYTQNTKSTNVQTVLIHTDTPSVATETTKGITQKVSTNTELHTPKATTLLTVTTSSSTTTSPTETTITTSETTNQHLQHTKPTNAPTILVHTDTPSNSTGKTMIEIITANTKIHSQKTTMSTVTTSTPTLTSELTTTTIATTTSPTVTTTTTTKATTSGEALGPSLQCMQCPDYMSCIISPVVSACGPGEFCMVTVTDTGSMQRSVTKSCASKATCFSKWWQATSDTDTCLDVDNGPHGFDQTCYFCCTRDRCNVGPQLVPPALYTP